MYFMWVPPVPDPEGAAGHRYDEVRLVIDPASEPEKLRRVVAALTFDQLTGAWQSSQTALARATDVRRLHQLVCLRAMLLDEVERRRPRVYRRWLRDGGPRHS